MNFDTFVTIYWWAKFNSKYKRAVGLEDMSNYDIPNHIITQMEPFYNDPKFLLEKAF